ncbi:MAG TPA: translocation/assembly module TamB domain-containing protein [Gemmatimonadaceae bacterium]|nr:translocation/assembly module TamB domain-containing protein [Gemmatimonadaceae bacterium]
MRRRHLVLLVSAATLLTLVIIAVAIVGLGVGTDAGKNQIRALIQQQVSSQVKGDIHIGRIRGTLLTGFSIDSFAIRDEQDSLLVSTGRITANYDPRDLMDRRLYLRNVVVENPVIRLRQYENGDWNYQQIFETGAPSTPGVPGRGYGDYVMLQNVRVKNGTFLLIRPWEPDDSLRGAKRDSAIRVNLANRNREIRRTADGFTHTYRWSQANAVLPYARLAHPDTAGQFFAINSFSVEEKEPPFSFRNAHGTVRKLGDSVFVDIGKFDLPASTGSAAGKIWWGSGLPIRVDVRVVGDSVSLRDVAWVYPTLPRDGGGRTKLHIRNNRENFYAFEYALTELDVRSEKSHVTGSMTFVVGNPVLEVRNVDLRGSPVNFDLLRTFAGEPFPVDWQGDLIGYARGPGGPLTNFVVTDAEVAWRDTHVPGAISRFSGRGELDILDPEFTAFHGFEVDVASLDLRSIQYLFPEFPRLGGTVAGLATLDSVWLDVRFRNANVTHRNGPGDPTRVTGTGRVTWSEEFMTYDVTVNAEPLSLDMMSRAYPLGLTGMMSGPIQAKGTTENLQLTAQLEGPAGRISYTGTVDAYPLSVAARGSGRVDGLDLSRLVAGPRIPAGSMTGTYQLDVRGDTNDLGTLRGTASALVERSEFDGVRIYPSRMRARFADGRMYLDTVRIESTAARVDASGALGLTSRVRDSLQYLVSVDSLGGLRRYIERFASARADGAPADSISGSLTISGVARGSLQSIAVAGRISGSDLFVRREAGREIIGSFDIADLQGDPTGTVALRFDRLNFGGILIDSLGAALNFASADAASFSIGANAVNGVSLAVGGNMRVSDSVTSVVLGQVNLATDSSRWTLAGQSSILASASGFSVDSLVLANGAGGRVSFEGVVPKNGNARLFVRADSVPLRDVGRIGQFRRPIAGWATVTAQGAGSSSRPVMNVQAQLRRVQWGGLAVERVTANGDYANNRATVGVDLARGGRTVVVARGSLPVELQYFGARLLQDSLRATVRTDSASFDVIEAFVPGLSNATGRMVANLDIGGSWEHPDVTGAFRVENGDVVVDSLGVRLRGVFVDMQMFGHADSLAIRRFVAWSGNSAVDSMSLNGYVAYRDLSNPYLDLRLNARGFHALDRRALARLEVSTEAGGLRLAGQLRGASLRGGIVVDRGTVYLPDPDIRGKQVVDFTSTIRDSTSATGRAPTLTNRLLESIIIDGVRVVLGDDVWLRSREANIKLGGTLNVQRRQRRTYSVALGTLIDTDSTMVPALDGELRAERGTYTLGLGLVQREFQVEGGTITFFGAAELAPELNISALHTVRTVNADDIRIRVRLTGPLYPNPIVQLESAEQFALSQSDLVSYLIFGQPTFQLGERNHSYAALAVATLSPSLQTVAAAQLRDWVGSAADFITIRPGVTDATHAREGAGGADALEGVRDVFWNSRFGYEQQLSNNLFVSVTAGVCQFRENNNNSGADADLLLQGLSGKLEYRISRDASIKAGKEPSNSICRPSSAGRVVETPSQWGLSLFKTWRF